MARYDMIAPTEPIAALPVVRSIHPSDLIDVLRKGIEDFRAMPTHVVFLSLIYPVVGILIGRATFGYDVVPLLYPLAAGFALLGPFAAIGLYELSRRREQGLDTSWKHAFDVVHSPSFRDILAVGALLLLLFIVWIGTAQSIYERNLGYQDPATVTGLVRRVLTTPEGHNLIIVGNLVGFCFAVAAMSLSVVSFPLLLDRHVGAATAMMTSLRAVWSNPIAMALWGLIVAAGLALGFLALIFGLAVVVPILGHSTWHLYRKVIEPDDGPRPDVETPHRGRRYAAEFPSSLFAPSRAGDERS